MPKTVTVALRKESVDRNYIIKITESGGLRSLSARRAWIEIVSFRGHGVWPRVALRKESVDRNHRMLHMREARYVALRKESVDRNILEVHKMDANTGRSPQGERG